MNEQRVSWKPVPGFEGRYEVSDGGQVRSLPRVVRFGVGSREIPQKDIYQHARLTKYGVPYMQVTLWANSVGTTFQIHVLVALAFIGPRPHPKDHACHSDGDSLNNHLSNIRWDTAKGNHADREKHGMTARGERSGTSKLTETSVLAIRNATGRDDVVAAKFGVHKSSVRRIRARESWGWLND